VPDEFTLIQFLNALTMPAAGTPGTFWNFDTWKPDVVIIELGTNDVAEWPTAPPEADFVAAYRAFLTVLHQVYPDAHIFCLGTFVPENGDPKWQQCNQSICEAVSQQNDPHVHCVNPSANSPQGWLPDVSDYIGDWTHPTVAGHTIIANHLHDVIAPIMGW
jgi:lysophospholipase L1-like esterase